MGPEMVGDSDAHSWGATKVTNPVLLKETRGVLAL